MREAVNSDNCECSSAPTSLAEQDDNIWRSLIGNRSAKNDLSCSADYAYSYRYLLNKDERDQHPQSIPTVDPSLFQKAMQQAIAISEDRPCRELLISSKGLLGLGPPRSQPGDRICLLVGYSMPVLLRI
jgi:hypothetical protein